MIPDFFFLAAWLLGNDRDIAFFSFSFFLCSRATGSLEYRKTAKAEPKPHGALFVRGGARRLCRERKKTTRKIGPTESVPAEGFILDCPRLSQLLRPSPRPRAAQEKFLTESGALCRQC